jgi:hypothetical protein
MKTEARSSAPPVVFPFATQQAFLWFSLRGKGPTLVQMRDVAEQTVAIFETNGAVQDSRMHVSKNNLAAWATARHTPKRVPAPAPQTAARHSVSGYQMRERVLELGGQTLLPQMIPLGYQLVIASLIALGAARELLLDRQEHARHSTRWLIGARRLQCSRRYERRPFGFVGREWPRFLREHRLCMECDLPAAVRINSSFALHHEG